MLPMSTENVAVLLNLKAEWNAMPWYKKWFYPRGLSVALTRLPNDPNLIDYPMAFNVCDAYLNRSWFFQLWSFSSLDVFSKTRFVSTLTFLKTIGLLKNEAAANNFKAVIEQNEQENLAQALTNLNFANLLGGESAQANFQVVACHRDPAALARGLSTLNNEGLLNQANRDVLAQGFQIPEVIVQNIKSLNVVGLLRGEFAEANLERVKKFEGFGLHVAIRLLELRGLFTPSEAQANFNAVSAHAQSLQVAEALVILNDQALLTVESTQAYRDCLVKNENPKSVADALVILSKADLLRDTSARLYVDALSIHAEPEHVALLISHLKKIGLLSPEHAKDNCNVVAKLENPWLVYNAFLEIDREFALSTPLKQRLFNKVTNTGTSDFFANLDASDSPNLRLAYLYIQKNFPALLPPTSGSSESATSKFGMFSASVMPRPKENGASASLSVVP